MWFVCLESGAVGVLDPQAGARHSVVSRCVLNEAAHVLDRELDSTCRLEDVVGAIRGTRGAFQRAVHPGN